MNGGRDHIRNARRGWAAALLTVWTVSVCSETARSQDRVGLRDPAERASAAMRQLELPSRRYEAGGVLWQLGAHAVAALAGGFDDPRPEVVAAYLEVLRFLPIDDPAVLARVEGLQASPHPGVALRAFECVIAQAHRGTVALHDYDGQWIGTWDGEKITKRHAWPGGAFDGDLLADGGAVAACGKRLLALAVDGSEAWEFASASAIDLDPLPGGRFLVGTSGTHDAYEIDREGTVHWRFALDNMWTVEVERLIDGRTLVSDHRTAAQGGGVHVVDAQGKLLMTLACDNPSDALMLADGAFAVALRRDTMLAIFEPDGTERLRVGSGCPLSDLQELPDGTLLGVGDTQLVRLARDGATIGRSELDVGDLSAGRVMAGGPLPAALDEPEPALPATGR